jgi:ABC-type bacteriocin/lantibiotic exporter with double-glycine peptidase domain
LLKNPALLVMDEATSDLDEKTQNMFQNAIELKFAGATIICIAHREETLRWCRTKIEMGWGKILSISENAEDGSCSAEAAGQGAAAVKFGLIEKVNGA